MSTPFKLFVTNYDSTDSARPDRDGVAVSSTTVYYSKMWGGYGSDAYDVTLKWTGTPTGTVVLQVANKPDPLETSDDDWTTSTEITVSSPAGSASSFRAAKGDSPGKKRFKYTNASGTGVLYGYVTVPRNP